MKIGILPGTFDPIHVGHIELAKAAQHQLGLDEVWLLVDADPVGKSNVTDFTHRMAMAKLAGKGVLTVDREPIQNRAERRTLQTARELNAAYPEDDFMMILGADVFSSIDNWEGIEEIKRLMAF